MTTRRSLKLLHLVSTIWFMMCIAYILTLALRQAGVNWWVIFSLSGHSAILILLLTSVYLFALFRGAGGGHQTLAEHPLTVTDYYLAFYVAAPLLGGLAGILGMIGVHDVSRFLLGVALGTLGTTFAVWVVIDPLVGLIESLLPASRKHRAERLAVAEAERRARHERRERLLAEAFAREERARTEWDARLGPQAERLAALLACNASDFTEAERQAVDIGAEAWRLGGITCMRQLHDTAVAMYKKKGHERVADYIACWWDGIGDWRRPSTH